MTVDGRRKRDTAEIVGNARGEVLRFCFVKSDEVARLDALARNLRALNGARSPRIRRPVLILVLLVSGLELVQAPDQTLEVFPRFGVRVEYSLTLAQAQNVEQFRMSHWPVARGRPTKEVAQGSLVRLALQAAEKDMGWRSKLAAHALLASKAGAGLA